MEVDLFIHGVPHGWDFWGKEADRAYFGNFYKPNQASHLFVIETRITGGHPYAYYHYLLNDDIVDYEGRDGSYVGVSVRMDAYCLRPRYVWTVLDRLFTDHLRPLLFEQTGPKLRWRTSALRMADKQIAAAQDQLLALMGATLRASDFEAIDTNIATRTNTGVNLCTVDATDGRVHQSVRQYGRVAIADTHTADRERQSDEAHQKQVNALTAAANQLKSNCQQQLYEAQQTQNALQQQVQNQQTEMARLQNELRNSDRQLQHLADRLDAAQGPTPRLPFGLKPSVMKWLPYVTLALAVLAIVLVFIAACKGSAPQSAPEGATDETSSDSITIEVPSGAVGGATPLIALQ